MDKPLCTYIVQIKTRWNVSDILDTNGFLDFVSLAKLSAPES